MERVLKISYFHILKIANLAKHIYGCSPFEQSYKIGEKKTANFDPYKGLLMKKAPNLPDFVIYINSPISCSM
jgi:hypothetical protein